MPRTRAAVTAAHRGSARARETRPFPPATQPFAIFPISTNGPLDAGGGFDHNGTVGRTPTREILMNWQTAALLGVVIPALSASAGDHKVVIQLRKLHTKSCVSWVEAAIKGKGTATVGQNSSTIKLVLPDAKAIDAVAIINALRMGGFEPLSMKLTLGNDGEVRIKSEGFGIAEMRKEFIDSIAEVKGLDLNNNKYANKVIRAPAVGEFDAVELLRVAGNAGFAVNGLDIQGTAPANAASASAGDLKQPPRDICIVTGRAARATAVYKGITIGFASDREQARFEALSNDHKENAIRDAVDRLGEERLIKKPGEMPAATASMPMLPTQEKLGVLCVIKSDPAKRNFTRLFKGLYIPLCCASCAKEWDALDDSGRVKLITAAAAKTK